jgi:hypothetical protein
MAGHSNGGQGLKQAVVPQKKRRRRRWVKSKAVQLHATEALGRIGGIAPTRSRPRH